MKWVIKIGGYRGEHEMSQREADVVFDVLIEAWRANAIHDGVTMFDAKAEPGIKTSGERTKKKYGKPAAPIGAVA